MRLRYALVLALFSSPAFGAWCSQYKLTLGTMQATETNFTVTVRLNSTNYPVFNSTLQNTGVGSCVTNVNGYDIVPYSDSGLSSVMNFSIIGAYNGSTGDIAFHILIPSAATGTVIYLGVGNSAITTFQGTTDPFDTNTKFYWNATSSNGSTVDASDASGNVATGTNHSGTIVAGNVTQYATNFASASSQYITWGTNVAATQIANNFTISFWVKTSQTTTACPIFFNQLLAGSNVGTGVQFNNGSTNNIVFNAGNTGTAFAINKDDGNWHYVVTTFASGTVKLYIDGGAANTGSNGETTVAYNTAVALLAGANNPLSVFCTMSVSDERMDNIVRGVNWSTDNFNIMSATGSFITVSAITGFGVSTQLQNYPINSVGPYTMTLNGSGTTWTSGTVFTISGANVLSSNVTSSTAATLTWNTAGRNLVQYPSVVSDGTFSQNGPNLMMPEITVTFSGGSVRYNNTHAGSNATNGDTWLTMDTVNGLRVSANDTQNPGTISANMAFFTETADLNTISLKNAMAGMGTFSQGGLAGSYCNSLNSAYTLKSRGMISFDGLYVWAVQCYPNGNDGAVVALGSTWQLSTSNDDGAHWARVQDFLGQATAASWNSGTATLTVNNTLSIGNSVIISACTPNAWNGNNSGVVSNMVTLTGATATTISFAQAVQPSAWQSGCTVIGPATTGGTPWSTPLYAAGRLTQLAPIQYCTDQVLCSNNPDSSGIYLLGSGATGTGTAGDPVIWRVPQSSFLNNPGSTSSYQYWQSSTVPAGTQGSWQSTLANATNPTCIAAGVASACNLWLSETYITDPAIPGGGVYVALHETNDAYAQGNGQIAIYLAQSIVGPYVLAGVTDIDQTIQTGQSAPTSFNFASMTPSMYTPISNGVGTGCIQFGGRNGSDYGTYHNCFTLQLGSTENSYIFNTSSPIQGYAGNLFHDIVNGLQFLWEFRTFSDQSVAQDTSPNKTNVTFTTASNNWHRMMTATDGLHNTTAIYNGSWGSSASWNNAVLTNANYGDFTVLVVARSPTTTGTQTIMGGSQSAGNGFMFKGVGAGVMDFIIELGGAGATTVACPSYSANTWFSYIAGRKGSTAFCFKSGTAAPVTTAGSATTLGASWTLDLGSESDGTRNFWTGDIGKIAIWNRALCSIQFGTVCASGDEVVKEFANVHNEGRGWGL